MINKIIVKSNSERQTIAIGEALGEVLCSGDIISLIGDLGCGKTRLAKGVISKALEVPIDEINSPSFTIVNRYVGPLTIDHADLYRVGPGAIEELGLMEIVDSAGVLLIEWASQEAPISEYELRATFASGEEENCRILGFEFRESGTWNRRLPEVVTRSLVQNCLDESW
ncbi:MAG: tRNA (adenosine(37)-N6)-threonylcarbamoyltransferase complex ATPase subunit type 1 TsaE [Desulfomonilaceae bacterium]